MYLLNFILFRYCIDFEQMNVLYNLSDFCLNMSYSFATYFFIFFTLPAQLDLSKRADPPGVT